MSLSETPLANARDPRLAPHALSAAPVWLWAPDGTRVFWANAAGAAALGEATSAGAAAHVFEGAHPSVRDIARLWASLPAGEGAQLARLRGLAPGVGRVTTCSCARFRLSGGLAAVLIVSLEAPRPPMPLAERVRRFLGDAPDMLAFAPDGSLLLAGDAALARLGERTTLEALGVPELAAEALAAGEAEARTAAGTLTLESTGSGDAVVLLARLAPADAPLEAGPQPEIPEATPAPPVDAVDEATDVAPAPEITSPAGGDAAADLSEPAPAEPDESAPAPPTEEGPLQSATLAALAETEARLVERRHPLRFVWTIDMDGCFSIESGEFTELAGAPTAAVQGRPWTEVVSALDFDRDGRITRAIASHDTWSSVGVAWPVEAATEKLPVLLSGLPVLARDRAFGGYRGFGVCREVAAIAAVIAARRAHLTQGAAAADVPAEQETEGTAEAPAGTAESRSASPPPDTSADERPPPPVFRDLRSQLTIVPAAKNVVPLRVATAPDKRPALSPVERNAFQEIARALGARFESAGASTTPAPEWPGGEPPALGAPPPAHAPVDERVALSPAAAERAVLDRLPTAVLVWRGADLILANRALFELAGYENLGAISAAGGLDALLADPIELAGSNSATCPLLLRTARGETLPVDGRLFRITVDEAPAMMLALAAADIGKAQALTAMKAAEATARELKSILDTATDGVLVVDETGKVLSANRSAEALFGYDLPELTGMALLELFAPESHRLAADYLDGLASSGVASLLNDGREVIGRVRQGGLIPLFMTMGRIAEGPARFCAVFRDITQWKRAEEELTTAKQQAEKASSAKSDFLAKISHEIRTPLNAIIGFSEVMMEERFGPIGNERYRGYARDIHASGEHMISLLNDLLDLSKIEAGKLDLSFARVELNDVMHQCVAIMQPQANRERIIIRTALSTALPPVVADARSLRQIVLNLLSNSIKFTGAGGQVIVSTALSDEGEAVMRVRDTGVGMNEKEIETALEPFRQVPTRARPNMAGTGLGLPLTKALAEANRAQFRINSAPNAGTLVEIVFPANRVLAE